MNFVSTLVALFISASVANAQMCLDRDTVVKRLDEKFDEQIVGFGLALEKDVVVELYASEKTGTFTLLFTYPNGVTCLVKAGNDWQTVVKPKGEEL